MEKEKQLLKYPFEKKVEHFMWSFKAHLGTGSFGKVYLGKDIRDNSLVAIKVICLGNMNNQQLMKYLQQEIQVMKSIKGEYIVNLIDVFWTSNNVYIITEYCEGGDLRQYQQQHGIISEEKARDILSQIVMGFKVLIDKKMIHRDLKPENILIKQNKFKLADFSFAMNIENNYNSALLTSTVGTPFYMSPQILKSESYTCKTDIWSLGLIFYEMIYGKLPYSAKSQYELINKILNQPLQFHFSVIISDECKHFIKGCLQIEECNRFNFKQLLEHPMLNQQQQTYVKETTRISQYTKTLDNKTKLILQKLQMIVQKNKTDLKKLFDILDSNKTGELDLNEFATLIKHINQNENIQCSEQEIKMIFDKFDVDQDQSISYKEFQLFFMEFDYGKVQKNKDPNLEEKAQIVLQLLKERIKENNIDIKKLIYKQDQSNKGGINIDQFRLIIEQIDQNITHKEVDFIFQKLDCDNSGLIDQIEFEEALNIKTDNLINKTQSMDIKFQSIIEQLKNIIKSNNLNIKKVFKKFDIHQRNALGINEFSDFMKIVDETISVEEIKHIFNKIDNNKDDLLNFEEFNHFIES